MNNTTSHYRSLLSETTLRNTLHESNWGSEDWKAAGQNLTQDILNDAFAQHGIVRSIFSDIGELTQRKCKSMARIEKKMTEQRPGRENYFKVVSDLVAVRVHCQVHEIRERIDRIRDAVLREGGSLHIRGSSPERPYGFFMDATGQYTDITQYVYVFLEKVGYPLEMQIGHPFASHTFTVDSALRDDPTCGKVDLWNDNFYGDVKDYLLAEANGTNPSTTKTEIVTKAQNLHPTGVPTDLQAILNTIK